MLWGGRQTVKHSGFLVSLVRARTLQSGWRRCHRPHKSEAPAARQEREDCLPHRSRREEKESEHSNAQHQGSP